MNNEGKAIIFNFVDGPKEIKVGDTVYYCETNSPNREMIVGEVGRKYLGICFSESSKPCAKFDIETGQEKTEYSKGALYSSKEGYDRIKEEQALINSVHQFFYEHNEISLEQALKIRDILGIK